MFTKILVANRGEIAVRIIRSAQEMGLQVVVIYSRQDKEALFVRMADEAVYLPGERLDETYLNAKEIVKTALNHSCDAIHPGYGFLSENSDFAQQVTRAGIKFIGPGAGVIELMGDKIKARDWVAKQGVPVIPAVTGNDPETLAKAAANLPFPLILKAASGGGGKGMYIIHDQKELLPAIKQAGMEASAYFGDDILYIEKYLPSSRHIEVQLLADSQGNIAVLSTRECSLQRRHQKVVEEAPAPGIAPGLRKKMAVAAETIARESKYQNAGTIEFLIDHKDHFYFLEMNTRLQVEHPVTEMITGLDLVKEQILIAAGRALPKRVKNAIFTGHAIEARIYAENPLTGFLPSAGNIHFYQPPRVAGIRTDSAIDGPAKIETLYDPLICKVIAYGHDREEAVKKMQHALSGITLHGLQTNQTFISELIKEKDFLQAKVNTRYIEQLGKERINAMHLLTTEEITGMVLAFAIHTSLPLPGKYGSQTPAGLWKATGYWRHIRRFKVTLDSRIFHVEIPSAHHNTIDVIMENKPYRIVVEKRDHNHITLDTGTWSMSFSVSLDDDQRGWITCKGKTMIIRRQDILSEVDTHPARPTRNGNEILTAPMTGKVVAVKIKEKDKVIRGQQLLVIEAMKMQNTVISPDNGIVTQIWAQQGKLIQGNEPLLEIENNHY